MLDAPFTASGDLSLDSNPLNIWLLSELRMLNHHHVPQLR